MKLPKYLVLDYDKWVCGNPDPYEPNRETSHGKGSTLMCNAEGFMCCLGQFSNQAGAGEEKLIGLGDPSEVNEYLNIQVEGLVALYEDCDDGVQIRNTSLADRAIEINDDDCTTVMNKALGIKELFAKSGYEVELVNFPE